MMNLTPILIFGASKKPIRTLFSKRQKPTRTGEMKEGLKATRLWKLESRQVNDSLLSRTDKPESKANNGKSQETT